MSLQELLELRTRSIEEVFESIRAMNEEIGDGFDIDVESEAAQHLRAALMGVVESLRAFREVLEASERVLEEIAMAFGMTAPKHICKGLAEHLHPVSDDEEDPAAEVKLTVPEGFDNGYEPHPRPDTRRGTRPRVTFQDKLPSYRKKPYDRPPLPRPPKKQEVGMEDVNDIFKRLNVTEKKSEQPAPSEPGPSEPRT